MLPVAQGILRNLPGLILLFDGSPTATPPVTATVGVEATATPVPVLPTPTPPPVPSPWGPGQWLHNSSWTQGFHLPFLVLFLVIALAAIVAYFYFFQRRYKDHKLHAHLAERVSVALTVFATVGLVLLLFAAIKTPFLSMPLWLILSMIAFLAFIFYCVYYYATIYPLQLATYTRELERARYIPKPKTKGPAYTPPMKKKQQKQQKRK
jgi:hypothetical protein